VLRHGRPGLIAYETSAREGLVLDEGVIVEIVRPGTGDPVPEGEVGELVVTTLNPDYPLIRFGTGDLSAVLPGACPTGRTNTRIKGWMGRADQTTKVRGMFVHPGQVDAIRESAFRRCSARGWWSAAKWPTTRWCCRSKPPKPPAAWPSACRTPCAKSPSCAAKSKWWRPAACPTTARSLRTRAATAVVAKINAALKVALKDADFIKKQEGLGAVVVTDKRIEPAEHKKFVAAEIAKWSPILKAAGVYAD
jgi:hypothetical protein